jgi:hypothetical protein
MISGNWKSFEVGQPGKSRSFHVGIGFDDESDLDFILQQRRSLREHVLRFYREMDEPVILEMPFFQLTVSDQLGQCFITLGECFKIVVPAIVCGGGIIGLGGAAILGADISISIAWILV